MGAGQRAKALPMQGCLAGRMGFSSGGKDGADSLE